GPGAITSSAGGGVSTASIRRTTYRGNLASRCGNHFGQTRCGRISTPRRRKNRWTRRMDSSAVYPRTVLKKLPAYLAGKPPTENPRGVPYKLASNENPYAPIKAATDAIITAATAESVQRFPETTYGQLRNLISETYDVPAEDITVGAGSLGVLTALIQTFAGTGDDGVE